MTSTLSDTHLDADHWADVRPEHWRWPDFQPAEMACRHCAKVHLDLYAMDRLQSFRLEQGKPFIVHSAYRCPEHNRAVGGAKASQHLLGRAFDISMLNHDPQQFEGEARLAGFSGIGRYPKHKFMHIDTRHDRASWGSDFPDVPASGRFAAEDVPTPKTQAAKGTTTALGGVVVVHAAATHFVAETGSVLPANLIAWLTAALALTSVGIVLWRTLGGQDEQ